MVWTNNLFYNTLPLMLKPLFLHMLAFRIRFAGSLSTLRYTYPAKYMSRILHTHRFSLLTDEESEIDPNILRLRGSQIDSYWIDQLAKVSNNAIMLLFDQLTGDNPLGYRPKDETTIKGKRNPKSLLQSVINWKKEHPEKLIMTRVGKFYESYGIDAIMLMEHCGLKPMGNAARAGTPIQNIQSTLNDLTNVGLSIAIYEESDGMEDDNRKDKQMKQRFLSQVIANSHLSPFTKYL